MEVLPQNSLRTERDRGSVKKVLASLLQPSFPFPGRYGFSGIRRNRWSSSWCSERLFFRYCEYWTRSCGFRKQQHQERNQKATTSTAESESNNINSGIRKQQHQQRNQKAPTTTATITTATIALPQVLEVLNAEFCDKRQQLNQRWLLEFKDWCMCDKINHH